MPLRIGSRRSELARIQAVMVGEALRRAEPGLEISYFFKSAAGDQDATTPLWQLPDKGAFTRESFRAPAARRNRPGGAFLEDLRWRGTPRR